MGQFFSPDLNSVTTFAFFHKSGNSGVLIDILNILVNETPIILDASFKSLALIRSATPWLHWNRYLGHVAIQKHAADLTVPFQMARYATSKELSSESHIGSVGKHTLEIPYGKCTTGSKNTWIHQNHRYIQAFSISTWKLLPKIQTITTST